MDSATDSAIWDGEPLRRTLESEITALRDRGAVFKVIEFGASGITVWTVSRDASGTPRARQHALPGMSWLDPDLFYRQELDPRIGATERLLIVSSTPAPDHRRELEVLRAIRDDAPVYQGLSPVEALLREAIREAPLTRFYELAVLSRKDDSGRLELETYPLFPPGATRGCRETFRLRCASGGGDGTVFAVIAREYDDYREVSLESAVMRPGVYSVTAELARPGRVVFDFADQAVELRPDQRSWPEVVAMIPDRMHRRPPVHLICMIEVSGAGARVQRRVDRLETLIEIAGTSDRDLRVSVVSYGPHGFDQHEHEEPAAVRAWATSGARAQAALVGLRARRAPDDEYPRAAQLECALAEVAARLRASDGRPVLVTAGSRSPHPARADLSTQILPCPARQDWRRWLQQIEDEDGIALGVLDEQDARGDLWQRLGRHTRESVKLVDLQAFAARLGLTDDARGMPLPLIVEA